MLLAIDMGNTQTVLGLFDADGLRHAWRMPTDRTLTKDELHVRLLGYFHKDGADLAGVDAIAFAGVVPQLMNEWRTVARTLGARMVVIGPETAAVTSIRASNPAEVGADRIANATAAAAFYGSPSIVVDFGTATNIDVIDEEGRYIGGAIAPGVRISLDALTTRAARLASVPLEAPARTIGRTTVEAVQSGTVVGQPPWQKDSSPASKTSWAHLTRRSSPPADSPASSPRPPTYSTMWTRSSPSRASARSTGACALKGQERRQQASALKRGKPLPEAAAWTLPEAAAWALLRRNVPPRGSCGACPAATGVPSHPAANATSRRFKCLRGGNDHTAAPPLRRHGAAKPRKIPVAFYIVPSSATTCPTRSSGSFTSTPS